MRLLRHDSPDPRPPLPEPGKRAPLIPVRCRGRLGEIGHRIPPGAFTAGGDSMLRGSQGPKSSRGIAARVFQLTQRVGSLRGVRGSGPSCQSSGATTVLRSPNTAGFWCCRVSRRSEVRSVWTAVARSTLAMVRAQRPRLSGPTRCGRSCLKDRHPRSTDYILRRVVETQAAVERAQGARVPRSRVPGCL
jgi:hypothetical protein